MKAKPSKIRGVTAEMKAYIGGFSDLTETKAFLKKIRVHVRQHTLNKRAAEATIAVYDPKLKTILNGKERIGILEMAQMLKARILK